MSKESKEELYASFDVETDGGFQSAVTANMWEFGVVFLKKSGEEVDSYCSLIRRRSGVVASDDTLKWIEKEGLMDKYVLTDPTTESAPTPETVCRELGEKLAKLSQTYKIVFVARPIAFDWLFLKTYYDQYAPEEYKKYVGFKGECLSTAYSTYCKIKKLTKEQNDKLWDDLKGKFEHTHNALDDARSQGSIYTGLLRLMDQ